jgi:flagellar biogenesis protein FliO
LTNATDEAEATGASGSSLFGILPFLFIIFLFVAAVTLLVKMVKGGNR